jgi:aryl-alcohol dehydrogenase-like predicted oxidoreductase
MNYRPLGRTGWKVSDISFGAWAIGGAWGNVSDDVSLAALNKAIDSGVHFIDTADVYGNGRSERLIAQLKKTRKEEIIVATKTGHRLPQQTVEGYSRQNLTGWIEDSLRNLSTHTLDLVQLHCPPTELYNRVDVFGILDDLVKAGKIRYYGVSVEKVDEALKAIEYPNVQTVQIIFNCFRQRPAEVFFPRAKQKQIGILARVPLASGLLTGKLRADSQFAQDDHHNFNRHGEAFDVGETFSGGLQNRAGSSGSIPPVITWQSLHVSIRPALDPHVRCGNLRHPRRKAPRSSRRELRCFRSGAAHSKHYEKSAAHL